ncbi:uncharacterized protein F5147DRAFT_540580, partial [Suillus discolor]
AQAEIDPVVGRDRLPTFEDRMSLPYLCVFVGVPHATTSDDTYNGYSIPKGLLFLFTEY